MSLRPLLPQLPPENPDCEQEGAEDAEFLQEGTETTEKVFGPQRALRTPVQWSVKWVTLRLSRFD